jgi:hypothetical protein
MMDIRSRFELGCAPAPVGPGEAEANPKEHERKRLLRSGAGFFLLFEGLDEVFHAQRSNNIQVIVHQLE